MPYEHQRVMALPITPTGPKGEKPSKKLIRLDFPRGATSEEIAAALNRLRIQQGNMRKPESSHGTPSAQQVTDGIALVIRAVGFAANKHRDQRRKDKRASPYINHPIALAEVLWIEGHVRDPAVIAAALLHDTIEDTDTTPEELKGEFGREIADIVEEVTDVKFLKKRSRKMLQVARASRASSQAKLVKLADKICNLRDIVSNPPERWSVDRKREYFDWAKAVVDQIRGTNVRLERRFDQIFRNRP